MVVQEDNLEMSLSSLFTVDANPIDKGNETERLWNSTSEIDSPSYSKPGDYLPLRPVARTKLVSAPTQHKQRGHNRPDGWVGKKSSKRSWKVKSITDVADTSLQKEESEEKDNESQDTRSILSSLPFELQEQAKGDPAFSELSKKQDSQHGDTKEVPDFVLPVKEKSVRGLESSMHSVLTDVSDTREMWTSMTSLDFVADEASKQSNDDDSSGLKSEMGEEFEGSVRSLSDVSATRDKLKMWQSMSAINTSFAFDSKDNCKVNKSARPKWKPKAASIAKVQSEVPENNQKSKEEPSAKDSKTDVLPDLEMSLDSLDMQSLEIIKEDETKKMWKSMSMIEGSSFHPNDALRQGVHATSVSHGPNKHKFRAHNRPDDWLGPHAKPSRRSWSAKKIVESSELLEDEKSDETKTTTLLPQQQQETNSETESEIEETSSVSKGIQMKRATPHETEKEQQRVSGCSHASLKPSSRGGLMKESGNLSNNVSFPVKADYSPTVSIKLRSTPNGSKVKQGDDIARKSFVGL